MISFLFLSPQIQDGDHYVKRPPPLRKSPTCHNHHVVKTFFQSHRIQNIFPSPIFLIECAYQHKIQHGCHIGLALLAQVPRLSDVQLLFHIGI